MWNTPKDCPTIEINKLSESEAKDLAHERIVSDLERATRLLGNSETVLTPKPEDKPVVNLKRRYDLHYVMQTDAPEHERWACYDMLTFDPGPDSSAEANFIGRGPDLLSAMLDLLDRFGEFDESDNPKPKPRAHRVIHSSREEPPTYADYRYEDPDADADPMERDDER